MGITTHGLRKWTVTGTLSGPGASYVRHTLAAFRADVEAAVIETKGELSVYHAALIQTACRHEGRAQLIQRLLRGLDADVSVPERIAYMKEIGAASDRQTDGRGGGEGVGHGEAIV